MHRRSLRGVRLPRAGRGEREDVGDVERAREQIRVAREVRLEQIDAPAMERHHRRVRRLEAVLDVHLQDAMLRRRVPAVGSEEVLHGVRVHTFGPDDAGTQREQDSGSFDAQRVRGAGERSISRAAAARPGRRSCAAVSALPWSAARPAADFESLAPWL